MRKELASLLIGIGLTFNASALMDSQKVDHQSYSFEGKIGDLKLHFRSLGFRGTCLEVTKTNGITVKYYDTNRDFKVDWASIQNGLKSEEFRGRDEYEKFILKNCQEAYEGYLIQIKQAKLNQ